MKKHELQEIKTYLDDLEPTGNPDDYHKALDWFWNKFNAPKHVPDFHNRVFDRFCFQAFERLGLNDPSANQLKSNEINCREFESKRIKRG